MNRREIIEVPLIGLQVQLPQVDFIPHAELKYEGGVVVAVLLTCEVKDQPPRFNDFRVLKAGDSIPPFEVWELVAHVAGYFVFSNCYKICG